MDNQSNTANQMAYTMVNDYGRQAATTIQNCGNQLLGSGRDYLQNSHIIGEGPKPLRALCFVGGIFLSLASLLGIFSISQLFLSPGSYLFEAVLFGLGIVVMIVESKDIEKLKPFRDFCLEWAKFLTVPAGKGTLYLLSGILAMSIFRINFLELFAGTYMAFLGVICIMVQFGCRNQLQAAGISIDSTGSFSRENTNERFNRLA
ncbi:COPI associated family protein [Cryptosporidium hominis]|uniref:Golgi apparatus membrane protein TVP15 n=1 Tax=Cryptosporidium hominis TaxID=237895 RepID=A0ABX5BIS3_CRYHO|nr:putative integral membrane protein [Cryptosporidium hominis]PPA63424.1 COPI associated family protein [Cryptosporidium hominis]PPS97081.1 Golgi apparatus membrane protein TVP15 [Cryptosporidium hominis]|eukprot:PPS97081.1 Golgi apparatus membrane protein TVP15 [Cryptosporidium hominis]